MVWVVLEGDEPAVGRQRPRKPDCAVPPEGSNLEDLLGPNGICEEEEELTLHGRHLNVGETLDNTGAKRRIECRVGESKEPFEILIDRLPTLLAPLHRNYTFSRDLADLGWRRGLKEMRNSVRIKLPLPLQLPEHPFRQLWIWMEAEKAPEACFGDTFQSRKGKA